MKIDLFFKFQVALLVLAALAVAEPEADAQYLLGNPFYANPHATAGQVAYANGAVVPADTLSVQIAKAQHFNAKANAYATAAYPYGYGLYGAQHFIGKREAEAEPKADAQYLATPYYGGLGYAGYGAVANYGYPAYANYAYANAAYPYGARVIGKREAEAEPEADAQYLASPYYAGYGAVGYPSYANYGYGYANTVAYPYAGAYGAHVIGKRDAESKPQVYGAYGAYNAYPYATYGAAYGGYAARYPGYAGYPYATNYFG